MTLLRKFISLAAIIQCLVIQAKGQNLYDFEHSREYAAFLLQSRQYKLAAMELERLHFMQPQNTEFRRDLIRAYRYSGQYSQGLDRLEKWSPEYRNDSSLFTESLKLNLLNGNFRETLYSLNGQNIINESDENYYRLSGLALMKNWNGAFEFIGSVNDSGQDGFNSLSSKVEQYSQIKFKKPGAALALSAVIPGLGKIYSNDWKDGLISFLFVATNAFQAYRGFSKDGVTSVYGWVFGTLSFGFYAGNLYGSWKSARDYNSRSEEALYHEIEHFIFDRF